MVYDWTRVSIIYTIFYPFFCYFSPFSTFWKESDRTKLGTRRSERRIWERIRYMGSSHGWVGARLIPKMFIIYFPTLDSCVYLSFGWLGFRFVALDAFARDGVLLSAAGYISPCSDLWEMNIQNRSAYFLVGLARCRFTASTAIHLAIGLSPMCRGNFA